MSKNNEIILLHRANELVLFAESLPFELVITPNTEPVYPVTVGEHLVNDALHILITHDWESDELMGIAGPITNCLIQLDTGVGRPGLWRELFAENQKLGQFLSNYNSRH